MAASSEDAALRADLERLDKTLLAMCAVDVRTLGARRPQLALLDRSLRGHASLAG